MIKKTGPLSFSDGAPEVDGLRLALKVAGDPVVAARALLLDGLGLHEGEDLWVRGTEGKLGSRTVLFLAEVGFLLAHTAGGLGGVPVTGPGVVKCKADGCGYPNKLHSVNLNNLPACQNPMLPPHTLKVF